MNAALSMRDCGAFVFMSSKKTLTAEDYQAAADALHCDVPAIMAVAEVEAPFGGFLSDGRVTVLFERHKFRHYTKGKFDESHPQISNVKRGGYLGGLAEWTRLNEAIRLDRHAAYLSTSWGKFQIMGFNFTGCGFTNVEDFVEAMQESEQEHLSAAFRLIEHMGLDDEMRRHDWPGFSRIWNGPDYKANDHDGKLARAWKKFAGKPIDSHHEIIPRNDPPPTPAADTQILPPINISTPIVVSSTEQLPNSTSGGVVASAPVVVVPVSSPSQLTEGQTVRDAQPEAPPNASPIQASVNGRRAWTANVWTQVAGVVTGGLAVVKENKTLLIIIGSLMAIALYCWFQRGKELDKLRIQITADPNKLNAK
jgi:hypothetical protein